MPIKPFNEAASFFDKFKKIPEAYQKAGQEFVKTHFEEALFEIVDPFESDMPILVIEEGDSDKITWHVNLDDGNATVETATSRYTGERRTPWRLFYWLNNGTLTRKVILPEDFAEETTPNSLQTVSQQYDRAGIQYTSDQRYWEPGIAARNWIELISEMVPTKKELNIKEIIKKI